jgi:hypothetical protein
MKKNILPVIAICFVVGFSSCLKDKVDSQVKHYTDVEYQKITEILDLPQESLDYSLTIPGNLGGNSFATQVNNDLATLGRVLF